MFADNFNGNNPEPYLAKMTCEKFPGPESQWQGENSLRFCDEDYDKLIAELGKTIDPDERAKIGQELNNILTKDNNVIIPLVYRGTTSAVSNSLGGKELNAWDSELWNVADWYRVKE